MNLVLAGVAVSVMACASPPAPVQVANLFDATDLQARDGTLYFRARGFVWSVPGDGTAPPVQRDASDCGGLRVDATSIYFFGPMNADSTCDLMVAPRTGGAATVMAPAAGPGRLEVTEAVVLVVNTGVTAVPLGGGSASVLGPADASIPANATALDATAVYWKAGPGREAESGATCGQQPLDGGPAIRWPCPGNGSIAAANNTYFASSHCVQGLQCGTIYKDLVGGPGKLFARSDTDAISGLVLSGDRLYWNNVIRIVRSNLDGGDQTVIAELDGATVDSSIDDFTVDDAYVYWASATPFAIWRSPK